MKNIFGISLAILICLNACTRSQTTSTPIDSGLYGDSGQFLPQNPNGPSLFEPTTRVGEQATVQPQTSPVPLSQQSLMCMSSNNGLYTQPSNTQPVTGSNLTQPACMSPNSPFFGQDLFLDEALQSMGAMQGCYAYVAAKAPVQTASQAELAAHFQGAQMALIRCYRRVLERQAQVAPWSADSMSGFNQVDANLYYLLNGFAQR